METHEREQAKANAAASVTFGEEDAQAAAMTAVAFALLDIATAIRELADVIESRR